MGIAKKIMMFAVMGAVLSALIAGLASVAPNIFGWLTLPFWLLPATLKIGAHDVEWPLFALTSALSATAS